MKKTRGISENNNSLAVCIAIGLFISLVVTVALSILLTSLIQEGKSDENRNLGVFAIRVIATLAGCITGAVLSKKKLLVVIGAISIGYFVILLIIGLLLFDGVVSQVGMGVLSVLLGGLIACAVMLRSNRVNKKRYIKK